jgi:hypothetical protein
MKKALSTHGKLCQLLLFTDQKVSQLHGKMLLKFSMETKGLSIFCMKQANGDF